MADAPDMTHEPHDVAAVLSSLQDQIDDLTATLESHQRLFERLRVTGLLPGDDGGDPR